MNIRRAAHPTLRPWPRRSAAALAILLLCGCIDIEVDVVTADNAHPRPILADGEYCELVLHGEGLGAFAELREDRCITITWVEEGRGWRTDQAALIGDAQGVSVRVRKLADSGDGPSDAIGLSSFFLAQVGPPPRQLAVGGRSIPVGRTRLLPLMLHRDMFVLAGDVLLGQDALARAESHGLRLTEVDTRTRFGSANALTPDRADRLGNWLGHELPRWVHAADLPGAVPERNPFRIFVPTAAPGFRTDPAVRLDRMRSTLDALVFQAGVLNQALGLGLWPARIDPERLVAAPPRSVATQPAPAAEPGPAPQSAPAPAPPVAPAAAPASPALQALYDHLQHCRGMNLVTQLFSLQLGAMFRTESSQALLASEPALADQLHRRADAVEAYSKGTVELETLLGTLAAEFEAKGVDAARGQRAFEAGTELLAFPDLDRVREEDLLLQPAVDALLQAYDEGTACRAALSLEPSQS